MRLIYTFLIFFSFLFFNLFAKDISTKEAEIFKNIRCLICQGQSIADSNSEFSQTLKLVVKDQIKEGKSKEEIYDFLIEKYGEWIVYKPTFSKNFILWLLPYIFLLLGGIVLFLLIKKRENTKTN
ncbi:MAG: cytochrome c-type biogenesis protein CcmH [Pelagibacteraceae bacterium]|jgi:cytochrome c-type biogenesis protein CcmH|tara:strand:+ start:145 stop:519 length:375 start_codon:yes stop_codon:yes gene_type:complete